MILCFTPCLVYANNAALSNLLATSRSSGNMHFFDENYQPGKISLQVLVLIIRYLVSMSFG